MISITADQKIEIEVFLYLCLLGSESEVFTLSQKVFRIFKKDLFDVGGRMLAAFHFERAFWNREGIGVTPVAGGVEPKAFGAVDFEHIDRPVWGAFAFRIKRHACPVAGIENMGNRVFFDVIDDDFRAVEFGKRSERVEDEAGPFEFVFKVGGVDQNRQIVIECELDVFFENFQLVAGIFVQSDLTDAEHGGRSEKLRDDAHHFAGETGVVRFFRIDAEPAKMFDSVFRGALGLVFGELAEIVVKSFGGRPVVAGPEGGFAERFAAGKSELFVVVGAPTDHVGVGFDVFHPGFSDRSFAGSAEGTLEGRGWEDFCGMIGHRFQHGAGAIGSIFQQDRQCFFQRVGAEILRASVAVEAIEKRGEVDELVARIDELQVENVLLARHG